ncbi:MAG: M48 family metallopeptidase [Verrucomicrobia bacterium]|nr:M48 family metallopeptidase [Verrucomicrobiota bacterium]
MDDVAARGSAGVTTNAPPAPGMIAWFIITTLFAYYLLDSAAKLLNLCSLRTEVPPEFQDVYDTGRYRRSQEYTKLNTWFELTCSTAELGVLLVFWAFDGFEAADRFVRTFGFHPVITGLLYFGILLAGETALTLPFKVYQTFFIEQKYGFNRTTVRTFIADRVKQWLISGIVMGLLGSIVLCLFETYGPSAWLIAWTCTAAVSVILVYIAPTVVLPLFFKTSPVPEGPLREQITQLATRERFPIRELLVIDGSRRSSKANAFFTGFGSNKRIALYDTLIKSHSVPELLAVLAHEIGHYKKHHIVRHFAFGQLSLLLLMLGASVCILRPELFSAFGVSTPSYYVGLVLYLIAIRPLAAILDILANYLSRRDEFEADRFAAQALGDPNPLIAALKRLSKDSLSNLNPHPLLVGLHFTHPPVVERVLALRKLS